MNLIRVVTGWDGNTGFGVGNNPGQPRIARKPWKHIGFLFRDKGWYRYYPLGEVVYYMQDGQVHASFYGTWFPPYLSDNKDNRMLFNHLDIVFEKMFYRNCGLCAE